MTGSRNFCENCGYGGALRFYTARKTAGVSRERGRRPVFVFHLWRSDDRAISNLVRFALKSSRCPELDFLLVNKSGSPSSELSKHADLSNTIVYEFDRDENYYVSHAKIPWSSWSWVTVAHDDDFWLGAPVPPVSIGPEPAGYPARTLYRQGGVASSSIYYGAIRSDIYSHLCSFAADAPGAFAGVDVVFSAWVTQLGLGAELEGYEYHYDARRWLTWSSMRQSYAKYARDLGWGKRSTLEAMRWTTFFDHLASSNWMLDFFDEGSHGQILSSIMKQNPPFGDSLVSRIASFLPARGRACFVLSRTFHRSFAGLRKAWKMSGEVLSPLDRLILSGLGRRRNDWGEVEKALELFGHALEGELLPMDTQLLQRLRWWEEHVPKVLVDAAS